METRYSQVWNALRWTTDTVAPKEFYGIAYLKTVVRAMNDGKCTRHIGRYLNQLVANGMARKPKDCGRFYRAVYRYRNTEKPLPRVKVPSELNRKK